MLSAVNADGATVNGSSLIEIVREGARRMPAAALEAEANAYGSTPKPASASGCGTTAAGRLSAPTVTRLTQQ